MTTQCVQVKLEIGHKATIRSKPTIEGFTHDWTVFVRGPEGSNIQNFVERVIFYLHESFPKPKRVVKEPPYQVSECGYAGFILPIEVFFRNRDEPKKVLYEYDLFLQLDGAPISSARQEKLTFQNPTEDFRRKLITAGGVGVLGSEGSTLLNQHQKPSLHSSSNSNLGTSSSSHGSSSSKPSKQISEAIKAPKSSSSSSTTSTSSAAVTSVSSSTAPVANPSISSQVTSNSNTKEIQRSVAAHLQPPTSFVDLFGQPIKTNRSRSPDTQKTKSSSGKPSKLPSSSSSLSSSNKTTTNNVGSSSSSKDSSDRLLHESKESKGGLQPPKDKSGSKRLPSPQPAVPGVAIKKRKGSASSSSGPNSSAKSSSKEKKNDTKKSSTKDKKREKGKHIADLSTKSNSDKKSTNEVLVKKERDGTSKSQKRPRPPSPATSNCSVSSELRPPIKASPKSPPVFHEAVETGDASPSSSISFSSLPHGSRSSGPLGALMAELDDEEDDDILSPLSSDPASPFPQPSSTQSEEQQDKEPLHTTVKTRPPSPPLPPPPPPPPLVEKKQKIKEEKIKKSSSSSSSKKTEKKPSTADITSKKKSKDKSIPPPPPIVTVTAAADSTPVSNITANNTVLIGSIDQSSSIAITTNTTEEYIAELKDLQKRIMSIRDRGHLQQIVNVIEETGLYQVTSTTFDFDLCTLDHVTVKKLQTFLSATV